VNFAEVSDVKGETRLRCRAAFMAASHTLHLQNNVKEDRAPQGEWRRFDIYITE
jgi:hypothetical protein